MLETARNSPMLILVALFLFVTMGALGSISATLAQVGALIVVPFIWKANWRIELASEPVLLSFLAAYFALAIAFAIALQDIGGALHSVNFLAALLSAILFVYLRDVESSKLLKIVAWSAFIGTALSTAVSLYQVWGVGIGRAEGWASNANVLARVALLGGFVSLIGFDTQHWKKTSLFLLGPVFGVIVVILSGSRGTFIAIPPLVLVFTIYFAVLLLQMKKYAQLWLLGGVAIVFGAIVFFSMSDRMSQIGNTISMVLSGQSAGSSTDTRIDMYWAGWNAFLASPFVGHGWPNIIVAADQALLSDARGSTLIGYRHLHNDFFNFSVGGGIVGIAAWMIFIFAPLARALLFWPANSMHEGRYLLVLLSISYLTFGLTDITFSYDVLTVSYFFIVAIALRLSQSSPSIVN